MKSGRLVVVMVMAEWLIVKCALVEIDWLKLM